MAETLTTDLTRQEIDARRSGGQLFTHFLRVSCTLHSGTLSHPRPGAHVRPRRDPLPSRSSARLAALTVAAVCSAAAATQIVALPTPAHADSVRIHDVQGTT